MSLDEILSQTIKESVSANVSATLEQITADFRAKLENLTLTADTKKIYTKEDLYERWGIKSYNTIKAVIIDSGILPAGEPIFGGQKLFWRKADVEAADERVNQLFKGAKS
ncbi:hypothetical protein [Francisella philomiragia]|uniref:Uncharacterized protein n=1 Tax=Francisella philomiragia TaxID=28110 RepID=A0ABS1GAE4_9GAMM|nr:hypothetical protein [Francisella philomiragia]MBK2258420.1 hypothetical protein [Francisella philomiragia]MBK2301782.1 hypothetical protein [Francisella philomiragia]